MAQITPIYELQCIASGTVNSEAWIDLTSFGPDINSPIPSGKQLWLGHGIFIAEDKQLVFEIRPNLPTKSAGTTADTQLRGYASALGGESKEMDFNYFGNITTLAPVTAQSTGVEKLWLRIRSGSNSLGSWSAMLFYTLY